MMGMWQSHLATSPQWRSHFDDSLLLEKMRDAAAALATRPPNGLDTLWYRTVRGVSKRDHTSYQVPGRKLFLGLLTRF
jgi:hypothetical protein